jgi:hypothetical protein
MKNYNQFLPCFRFNSLPDLASLLICRIKSILDNFFLILHQKSSLVKIQQAACLRRRRRRGPRAAPLPTSFTCSTPAPAALPDSHCIPRGTSGGRGAVAAVESDAGGSHSNPRNIGTGRGRLANGLRSTGRGQWRNGRAASSGPCAGHADHRSRRQKEGRRSVS